MHIEDEIKQGKEFTSEYEKLAINILFTASWLDSKNIQRFKPFGISPQQYNVLRILRGSNPKPLMLGDIASRMIDKNSNTTRLVEKLRLKNFVKREVCENNRRQVDISITRQGITLLAAIDIDAENWIKILKNIDLQKAITANQLLDSLRD